MSDVIGQSITFSNGVSAPNRFLKSAMTERLCSFGIELEDRGVPTEEYQYLYKASTCLQGWFLHADLPTPAVGRGQDRNHRLWQRTMRCTIPRGSAKCHLLIRSFAQGHCREVQARHKGRQSPRLARNHPDHSCKLCVRGR